MAVFEAGNSCLVCKNQDTAEFVAPQKEEEKKGRLSYEKDFIRIGNAYVCCSGVG
jgi:hypothetical protein